MKFNPKQSVIWAKKSSLAISIYHDDDYELSFYVYNRRTHSIVSNYKVSLMEHCRRSMLNVDPIRARGRRKCSLCKHVHPTAISCNVAEYRRRTKKLIIRRKHK